MKCGHCLITLKKNVDGAGTVKRVLKDAVHKGAVSNEEKRVGEDYSVF